MNRKRWSFSLIVGIFISFGTAKSRGAADAPVESKPAAIAHLTLGSLNQITSFADDLEVPLPSFLSAGGLEEMFDFIGAGGIRKELPISLDYLAGGDLQQGQQVVFFLPVVEGHAPIATFVQKGQALGTDAALVNGIPFRRTGNYIMWGGNPDLITAITPERLPDTTQNPPLLEIVYNGKLLREIAPQQLEGFRKTQLEQDAGVAKSKSELAGQRWAVDSMTRGLDLLSVRLEKVDDLLRVTTQIDPAPTFTVHTFQRPGLPEGCAFRIDWQPPHDWVRQSLSRLVALTGQEDFYKDAPGDAKNHKPFEELIVQCTNAVFDGDAATYAMELADDGPVFYSVTQSAGPRDVGVDFSHIENQAASLDGKGKKTCTRSNYKLDDGTTVARLIGLGDDGKPEFYVDTVDREKTRMTTVSKFETHAIGRLLQAKPVGPSSDPATGWVDGKLMLALVANLNGSKGAVTDEDEELLSKVLNGQRLNWTVNSAQNHLNLVLDVPVLLLKNISHNSEALGKTLERMNAKPKP